MNFWQSNDHEIDFVLPEYNIYLEVKSGKSQATDFVWFLKSFQHHKLTVVNKNQFETERISGMALEDFLINGLYTLKL